MESVGGRGGELLFSGARQARINCRVIYCTTDLLGKFSTEVRVTEKPDCPVKAIKFLRRRGWVGPNRFSLRQRTESGTCMCVTFSTFTRTDMKQKCSPIRSDRLKKKRKGSSQRRSDPFGGLNLFPREGNRERQSITAFVPSRKMCAEITKLSLRTFLFKRTDY